MKGIVALHEIHLVQRVADHVARVVFTISSHIQIMIVVRPMNDRVPCICIVLAAGVLRIILLRMEVVRIVLVVIISSSSVVAASSVSVLILICGAQSA